MMGRGRSSGDCSGDSTGNTRGASRDASATFRDVGLFERDFDCLKRRRSTIVAMGVVISSRREESRAERGCKRPESILIGLHERVGVEGELSELVSELILSLRRDSHFRAPRGVGDCPRFSVEEVGVPPLSCMMAAYALWLG